jgi:hypothetical protein
VAEPEPVPEDESIWSRALRCFTWNTEPVRDLTVGWGPVRARLLTGRVTPPTEEPS